MSATFKGTVTISVTALSNISQMISFKSHKSPVRKVILLSPFCYKKTESLGVPSFLQDHMTDGALTRIPLSLGLTLEPLHWPDMSSLPAVPSPSSFFLSFLGPLPHLL